jgi:hypothetical protein
MSLCRHCDRNPVNRSRGLCWSCFYTPGVRERYPPVAHGKRGLGMSRKRLLCEPTEAIPGTPEKIRVLMDRAARGLELFHEQDADLWAAPLALVG